MNSAFVFFFFCSWKEFIFCYPIVRGKSQGYLSQNKRSLEEWNTSFPFPKFRLFSQASSVSTVVSVGMCDWSHSEKNYGRHLSRVVTPSTSPSYIVSFAAVIRVVTRHATLLERCVTSDDPNNGCEGDYLLYSYSKTSLSLFLYWISVLVFYWSCCYAFNELCRCYTRQSQGRSQDFSKEGSQQGHLPRIADCIWPVSYTHLTLPTKRIV